MAKYRRHMRRARRHPRVDLIEARKAHGLERFDLAPALGCSTFSMMMIEHGRVDPSFALMSRWADMLGISYDLFRLGEPCNDVFPPGRSVLRAA